MSVPSVDLEMQPPSHPRPTATGSDEEEGQQCWRDVEAETGFRSYESFLEALPETGPHYKGLLSSIVPNPLVGEVNVLDILDDGRVSISMNLQGRSERTGTGVERETDLQTEFKHCAQLLRNLRSPPENTPARIVVWSIPRGLSFHAGLVDAIGLGLQIQPAVFSTLLSNGQLYPPGLVRRLGLDYVIIGNSVATVARKYRLNKRVPPVLLVARVETRVNHFGGTFARLEEDYDDMVKEALTREKYGSISPYHPASDMHSLKNLAPKCFHYLDCLSNHVYLKLLSKYVQKSTGIDVQSDILLLNAILPLLHLEVLDLRAQCEIVRKILLMAQKGRNIYESLEERHFDLRRKLENLNESRICFVRFARLQNASKWLEEQPWISQEEEIIEAVNEARGVQAEARDFM